MSVLSDAHAPIGYSQWWDFFFAQLSPLLRQCTKYYGGSVLFDITISKTCSVCVGKESITRELITFIRESISFIFAECVLHLRLYEGFLSAI